MKNYSLNKLPSDILSEVALKHKRLRKKHKLSQAELAERSGVSLGSIKRFEQSGRISLESLLKLGIVEKSKIIDGQEIKEGDSVIGIASNGLHSNGFSLVRKVLLEDKKYELEEKLTVLKRTLGEELLQPTKIYVKAVLHLIKKYKILGIAHITGGGIVENIPRILPEEVSVQIDQKSWPKPPIFSLIQKEGKISDEEMYRTFNMGIGMVIIVPDGESEKR